MTDEREPPLTETAVRKLARSKSYDRGQSYYEEGRVLDVTRRGELLQAAVEGSQYEPYTVLIEFNDSGVATTECSCPYDYGGICKHRVAVLLTYLHDSEVIDQRPAVSEVVDDASREQLVELIVELVETHPHLVEWIETQLESHDIVDTTDTTRQGPSEINLESIRQQVKTALPNPNRKPRTDAYTLFEQAADDIQRIIEQAWNAIEAADADTALDILAVTAEEITRGNWIQLMPPDSYAMDEVLEELDAALAEAVLMADFSETERDSWAEQISEWNDELTRYAGLPYFQTAVAAATRGWEDDLLQQALQGELDAKNTHDSSSVYTDGVTDIRLNVLERQDRIEEYLNLAAAAGKTEAYATMLAKDERFEEAVEYGIEQLETTGQFLALAKTLRDHDRPREAMRMAEHGLTVDGPKKDELGAWLRDCASSMDEPELALEGAIESFKSSPSLVTWQAVEALADDDWESIRLELLEFLSTQVSDSRAAEEQVDVFLYENQYDEAIAVAEAVNRTRVIEPVVDAVLDERSQWAIDVCKEQAEQIIEQGEHDRYRTATRWLEKAGTAAQAAGEQDEWREYVEAIIEQHSRKYKLVPMLEELLDEFSD